MRENASINIWESIPALPIPWGDANECIIFTPDQWATEITRAYTLSFYTAGAYHIIVNSFAQISQTLNAKWFRQYNRMVEMQNTR